MPCPCRVPFELYPEATEWGPLLWTLLHGLAERSGRPVVASYAEDERRAWLNFFKQTGDIIPCPACKEHFQQYLAAHPVSELKDLPIHKLRDWLRDWFWEVHEWVNETLRKPAFPKEQLAEAYGRTDLRAVLRRLEEPMKRAITLSGNNYKKFTDWKAKYVYLLSILGV